MMESQFHIEQFTDFLKTVLDSSWSKATALILRNDYQEQIEAADDPDELAMHQDRALELLAWRSVRAAVHLFVRGGLAEHLSSARGEDLAVLYCSETLSSRFGAELAADQAETLVLPVAFPPDDDLLPVPGFVELRRVEPKEGWITLWGEWTDLLGEPPERIDWVNAVANALSEARKRALRERPVTALVEMFEKVENIESLQTVLADLIDRLITRVEGGSSEQAWQSLQSILGKRIDGLCPEAQAALLACEQIRLSRDFADPSTAMMCLGRAVELQLRYQTEKRLRCDCRRSPCQCGYRGLIRRLYPVRETNLGSFLYNLHWMSEQEADLVAGRWFERGRGESILREFNNARNRSTHGEPQAKQVVDSAVGDWFGASSTAVTFWAVLTPE